MSFHQKYRPSSLSQVIGHSKAVATMQGWIEAKEFPSAILFTGPTSVGKTTLARAFASDILDGAELEGNPNWMEVNIGDNRSIDDIRGMIQVSRLRPQNGAKRRFILADEVQQILSNNPAAQAFLKPLEEPVKSTTFLLGSMEADKFKSTQLGRAIAGRCVTIVLEPPAKADMLKQAKRICKGEKMSYVTAEVLDALIDSSESSMRVLANHLEKMKGYFSKAQPESLSIEDLGDVLAGTSAADDVVAVKFLTAVYAGKFLGAQKALLEMTDPVTFINKVSWASWFVLNTTVLKGARHPKVWGTAHTQALVKQASAVFDTADLPDATRLAIFAEVNSRIVKLRLQSGAFAVDEGLALSAFAWDTTQAVKKFFSTK